MPLNLHASTWRLKLRSIFLAVSLFVLVLPLGGIYFLRIYENELVKQTELELISQAALISAVYKRELETLAAEQKRRDFGIGIVAPPAVDDYYTPIRAELNRALRRSNRAPRKRKEPTSVPTL